MNKLIVKTILFSCTAMILNAQDTTFSFGVDEAVDYALEYNKSLQNARQDVLITEEQIKSARSQGITQVNATVNYMTNFNYEFEFSMGAESEPPQIDYSQLDQGDYEILDVINQMFSAEPATIVMEDQANAQIQVSQLIFSGQYWIGMQTAKIAKKLTEQNLQKTELDVKENVMNTYHLILITEQLLDIVDKNIDNLNEVYKQTETMYTAGMAESTDVDQIRINVSQLKNTRKSMERNIELSYNMLRFQLGLDVAQNVHLTDSLQGFIENIAREELLNNNHSIENNPMYNLVETQVELSEKQVRLQQWAYAPILTGYYSYTEKFMAPVFDLSPKNAAGLTLNVPIFSGGERLYHVNQAKIELDKAITEKDMIEEQLQLQEKQLRFELKSAFENYMLQKENVEVAQRVYNNIYSKYKQGLSSSLDLTQANSNYLQAENNYISSIMDLLKAKLKLDKLYNQL